MAYFIALKRPTGTPAGAWQQWEQDFRRRFDVMSVQRNLKALGTFGYQTSIRQNPVYIQYIPRTLHHVQQNLARHDRFARLREILSEFIPELR